MRATGILAGVLALGCSTTLAAQTAPGDGALDRLATRMVDEAIAYDPSTAYFVGVPPRDNRGWADYSAAGFADYRARNDALLADLKRLDPATLSQRKRFTYAGMIERLEAERAMRVCRLELWDVNHMSGWHLVLSDIARDQPLETAAQRADALARWSALPAVVDTQIANARAGLAAGYSAPRAVVARVVKQIDGIANAKPEDTPFWQLVDRSKDTAFKASMRAIIVDRLQPAFARYHGFLRDEYAPRAREALAVSANPDGRACYAASLRFYTTLARPPEQVFQLGQQTVSGNLATVRELGGKKFGSDALPDILAGINQAADNKFTSEQDQIAFSSAVVDRARQKSAPAFAAMPVQRMEVKPFEPYLRGSGASSYYERQIDPKKLAYYRIASEKWQEDTRGGAEITAVHEGYPGHHMQVATATEAAAPVDNLLINSAYSEGWARYSEALSEELGIYQTDYALMTRRLWPARGMVIDPGLHVMGWTREQAIAFIRESGRWQGSDADDLIDRVAIIPGQLTAYDSGGLEIRALRQQAEAALGACFGLPEFHARVLETGIVPLSALRAHIEQWVAAKSCPAGAGGERGR
ncbi:DUF885 domain-containing protein [Sphingomonas sabuli]|uniref:DUF885 domain-containing protein n=1 Tax=Sphingomonas sabuli TaxID=2764186 RepID=A0A7G9L2S3_9SPHN|nr:DUF885 domain-containing protein [Sphingomonas sabuli]QNM82922.1 DUF885 domain-containing protein [Sphingomonas sabuli]